MNTQNEDTVTYVGKFGHKYASAEERKAGEALLPQSVGDVLLAFSYEDVDIDEALNMISVLKNERPTVNEFTCTSCDC